MHTFRKNIRFLFPTLLAVLMIFGACSNPFDPLDESSRIRGLSYIDFALTWDRWDSDPEGDGVSVTVEYFNEFGDSLSFHDKPHEVVIEFWTQELIGAIIPEGGGDPEGGRPTNNQLIFSFPVEHDFSDDDIRIPIEAYDQALEANFEVFPEESITLFVIVRVFPPLQDPQPELVAFYSGQTVFEPEEALATEGTVP
jgi:hypothetical protein